MKPLKIALVRQRYNPYGGAERFVERAIEALQGQGVRLTIVARRWVPEGNTEAFICDPFYFGSLWRDLSFARCACRALAQGAFDLVQSHERIACCDVYRAGDGVHREWLAQRRRTLGGIGRLGLALNPYHRYVLAAERKLFASPRLKAVICNSRMVKEEIQAHFALPEEMLHVIYSGVDTERFHPRLKERHRSETRLALGIPRDATLFLFVGSGFERKGLAAALEALARLPGDAYLAVVGRDKRALAFRAVAGKLGVAQRVCFVGGQEDVAPYYGAADAFVLPALYDPFPNAALEAMAAGLPVVTSTKCGAAELLREGESGFVRDALDKEGITEAMGRLLDPRLRTAMGRAARQTAAGMGLEAMAAKMLRLYQALLEGSLPSADLGRA